MECIYNGRKYRVFSRVTIPKREGNYVYFLRIGSESNRKFKIGISNNIMRRMVEHCKYYGEEIYILWISPCYSKYTTLRVEDTNKERWIRETIWEYIENDRFIIPESVDKITIKVKKEYEVVLE